MAESRMAGDALSTAARNKAARERRANDPEKSAALLAQIPDEYKKGGHSDKDLLMAFQGSKFDDVDYARLTGEDVAAPVEDKPAEEVVEDIAEDTGSGNEEAANNIVKNFMEKRGQGIGPGGGLYSDGMSQNVNQDNDITTNVTGDNNTVENNQNNRVSQGGGSDYAARFANRLKDQYVLNLRGK